MKEGEFMAAPKDDYFAEKLLGKLDETDPIFAAYEAQDVSREVGFDFSSFQATLERALDEIREALEAKDEDGDDGHLHYGDEIADIIFSLINLARHAGISDMPTFDELTARVTAGMRQQDSASVIEGIGANMRHVGKMESQSDVGFQSSMHDLFEDGTVRVIEVAMAEGFNPQQLLVENVRKYLKRCRDIESLAARDGKFWSELAANGEIIAYWKKAKTLGS